MSCRESTCDHLGCIVADLFTYHPVISYLVLLAVEALAVLVAWLIFF
jgi:hypothetical protein